MNIRKIFIIKLISIISFLVYLSCNASYATNFLELSKGLLQTEDTKTIYLDHHRFSINVPKSRLLKLLDKDGKETKNDTNAICFMSFDKTLDNIKMTYLLLEPISSSQYQDLNNNLKSSTFWDIYKTSMSNEAYNMYDYIKEYLLNKYSNTYYLNAQRINGVSYRTKVNGNYALVDTDEFGKYDEAKDLLFDNSSYEYIYIHYITPHYKVQLFLIDNWVFNPIGKAVELLRSIKEY